MSKLTLVALYRSFAPAGFDPRCEDAPPNAAFLATLPEEIRGEPSLKSVPDMPTLAKNYVNAQKLIGTKRIAAPDASWNEQQWNEFYDGVGRPKTPDQYKIPEVKLEDGITMDKDKLAKFQGEIHKMGLTQKQAEGVLGYYLNSLNEGVKGQKSQAELAAQQSISELRGEWGEKFDANVDLAKAVVRKFGDEKFTQYIEGSNMGNNPQLIRMLSKVGAMMLEDKALGGDPTFGVKDSTKALSEIDSLRLDKEFQVALNTQNHPAHKAAVDRWLSLHKVAHPGQERE